jgi:hypothetical protein
MKLSVKTTVAEFSVMLLAAPEREAEFVAALGKFEYGAKIGEISTPNDLTNLTYGQRVELANLAAKNVLSLPFSVLLGKGETWVAEQPVCEVYGFSRMVVRGLEQIAQRDSNTFRHTPTDDERRAGIDKLNFGYMGTIDTVARRMGISYEEVLRLPEVEVFQMLWIDYETAQYERRLRKIKEKKEKRK